MWGMGCSLGAFPVRRCGRRWRIRRRPSTTLRVRIRPTTETPCPQVTAVQQGFGYPCDYVTTPPAAVAQTSSAVVFASNYRVPVVQRATLLLERNLGARTLVRLSYATALATQLPGSTDINIAPSPGYASYVLQGGAGTCGFERRPDVCGAGV